MRCKDLLIACKGDSDISSALNVFTNVLIEGYESKCKDYNISGKLFPFILSAWITRVNANLRFAIETRKHKIIKLLCSFPETCVPMILIKNFFACGLRFHQSYNEFSPTYLGGQPFLCRYVPLQHYSFIRVKSWNN